MAKVQSLMIVLLVFAYKVSADCPEIADSFPHGDVQCSNGDHVSTTGTVCQFNCTEPGYEVYPAENNPIECLDSGMWDKPPPCCTLPCPPYVLFDIISISHAETNETFNKIFEVGSLGLRNVVISPENGTMYAKVEFSGNVHETRRSSFTDTLTRSWNSAPPYVNTADGLVNIGHALTWILENMTGEENGERPLVPDVVLVGTDSESTDNVTAGVQAWLDRGALIYVLVFLNPEGEFPRHEKMLEIAQEDEHVIYYDGDSATAADQLFGETFEHICEAACEHVLHDHE